MEPANHSPGRPASASLDKPMDGPMNGRVAKSRLHGSHVKLSQASQARLLDAALGQDAGHSPSAFPPLSGAARQVDPYTGQTETLRESTASLSLFPRPEPSRPSRKRRADTSSDINPPPTKRLGADVKEEEQTAKAQRTTLQHPKPISFNRSYPSLLQRFADSDESVNNSIYEWLNSIGPDREKRCRSDSHIYRSGYDPVSRKLTNSAPAMEYTRDTDGFMVPPTPASAGPRLSRSAANTSSLAPSNIPSSSPSSARTLVEDPNYRIFNLAANNIYFRNPDEEFPEHIADLVQYVSRDRDSPGPSPDQLKCDADLYGLEDGAGEPQVEEYFRGNIFPKAGMSGSLRRSDRQMMVKHQVPSTGSKFKVSTPVPDMLYGYRYEALAQQQTQLISMGATQPFANTDRLVYPFFVIEFKGEGGNLWVATNQCLGGSATCVNITERLNHQLQQCQGAQLVGSATFSIAMSGTEARLYISWKHNELDFYMRKIRSFCLQEPDQYLEFRKYVRNIIDWGKDVRLKGIRDSLDVLLEEGRKRASTAAKSRQPPADSSSTASTSSKKGKLSSLPPHPSLSLHSSTLNNPHVQGSSATDLHSMLPVPDDGWYPDPWADQSGKPMRWFENGAWTAHTQ